jgi:hypothetical protein
MKEKIYTIKLTSQELSLLNMLLASAENEAEESCPEEEKALYKSLDRKLK